ncbi:MAG: hypothetical protein ACKO1L_10485, partial [Brachymonas sp.]
VLSVHVDDPNFSWSKINGEDGEEILPALMISTIHPQKFRTEVPGYRFQNTDKGAADENLVLIPLKEVCKDSTEVVALIERIFRDISSQKPLKDFAIAKEIKAGSGTAYANAFILKPALWGMGVDLKELVKAWRTKSI